MFVYYFRLALHSLKRNVVLTLLMIAAIGVGIGASMTMLTLFRAMGSDPIPNKSSQLFAAQIDNWGPGKHGVDSTNDNLEDQLSYQDAIGLMNAHAARRQIAMYLTGANLMPANPRLKPFQVRVRATYADFFSMFEVPFRYGTPWTAADDATHSDVVVITQALNDKEFGGTNSVGKTLALNNHAYRVVGILNRWEPLPKFYDVISDHKFDKSEDVFLPFTRAIEAHMGWWGNPSCKDDVGPAWGGRINSSCVWIQFWAELPTAAEVARYRVFLNNYALEQQRSGRFNWPPNTQLRDVRQWLVYEHVVADEVRVMVVVSFSFLLVCLLNAMGLMLAKIMGSAGDIGVRRALGATRGAIFAQCLIETGVIGLGGGVLGLAFTSLGLWGVRALFSVQVSELTRIDLTDTSIALLLAVTATLITGLYPTWRAAQVQPAWQLKAQ